MRLVCHALFSRLNIASCDIHSSPKVADCMKKLGHREVFTTCRGHTYKGEYQKVQTGPAMLMCVNMTLVKLQGYVLFRCVLLLAYIRFASLRWNVPKRRACSDVAFAFYHVSTRQACKQPSFRKQWTSTVISFFNIFKVIAAFFYTFDYH